MTVIASVLRAIGIFGRRNHQFQLSDSVLQRGQSLKAGPQVPRTQYFGSDLSGLGQNCGGGQFDNHGLRFNAVIGHGVEIDEWRGGVANNANVPADLGHLVTHTNPPSLKTRFGKACRAFVNAWRQA